MLQLISRTKHSLIGVDIGCCSLRAVQLCRKGAGWDIHHWFNIEFEPTTPEPPTIDYAAEVQPAFGPGTFSGIRTALVLSPPEVEYKLLDVPAAILNRNPAELRTALQFELEKQLPWPVAESEIAAWPIQAATGSIATAMVVAARGISVQRILDTLATRELECDRADIVPNAMINVCASRGKARTESGAPIESVLWGVLDIGFRSARLYLIHGDRPVYARVLRGGGREMTETLATSLHVDFHIAEQYKRIYGIRQTERGFRSVVGGISKISEDALPSVLYAIVRPVIDAMVAEIERSCRFAVGKLPGVTAGTIYLIGGGARLTGLAEALGSKLGSPVGLPDPRWALASTLERDPHHPACSKMNFPTMAACIGLALKEES